MAMVVRSNMMAMNANRQLGMNNSSVSKSLEKLSSGFKINRAGDDASGLAISEKMKAQIKGLEQASSNSQDGISLVQTAEGALTEVHSMLNRMTELATKSANGTIQDVVDREAIQSEVDALTSEIDRIGDSTNFNGIKLLDGSMSAASSNSKSGISVGTKIAAAPDLVSTDNAAVGAKRSLGAATVGTVANRIDAGATMTFTYKDKAGVSKDVTITLDEIAAGTSQADINSMVINKLNKTELGKQFEIGVGKVPATGVTNNILEFTAKGDSTIAGLKVDTALAAVFTPASTTLGATTAATKANTSVAIGANVFAAGDAVTVNGKTYEFVTAAGDKTKNKDATAVVLGGATQPLQVASLNSALKNDGFTVRMANVGVPPVNNLIFEKMETTTGGNATGSGLVLQIGDTGDDFNKVEVKVDDMRSKSLGVNALDVSTADAARASIQVIKDGINKVSTNRANLGAMQNRLEYTINNLDVTAENMNAANSRIRDTDMAKQMMDYTKMNVLTQSAQAMLAQANQQPQSILQLLQ